MVYWCSGTQATNLHCIVSLHIFFVDPVEVDDNVAQLGPREVCGNDAKTERLAHAFRQVGVEKRVDPASKDVWPDLDAGATGIGEINSRPVSHLGNLQVIVHTPPLGL